MRIGRMNQRLQLQRVNSNAMTDRYGQQDEPFETFATVWASVMPLSGRELTQARQRQSLATHTIRMRFRNGIDETMRAKLGSRVLNFESASNVEERGQELVIVAIEQRTGAEGTVVRKTISPAARTRHSDIFAGANAPE